MKVKYVAFVALVAVLVGASAYAQGNCYDLGKGPIRSCYEDGEKVLVAKSFMHSNNHYLYDPSTGKYCYENEYGNERCMQMWKVEALECTKSATGPLKCE